MKTLITLLMVFSTNAFAANSFSHIPMRYQAALSEMNIDPNLKSALGTTTGYVDVDLGGDNATLTLLKPNILIKIICAPESNCNLPGKRMSVNLPIIFKHVDECGVKRMIAEQDLTPVDGDMQRLVIVDNSQNTCPTFMALPDTTVEYITVPSGIHSPTEVPMSTHSTFTAERFQPIYSPISIDPK